MLGVRLLPRTSDRAMPHVWEMVSRLSRSEVRGGKQTILSVVTSATWYSFRVALAAFVIGSLLGIGVAVLMARFKLVERGLMPYLIMSQTVPIIVLGPLIVSLMAYNSRDLATKTWIAATLLGVFLAFFPVAVATLRGLQSTPPAAVELMESLASPWWRTLLKLRFPGGGAAHRPGVAPGRCSGCRRRGGGGDLARHTRRCGKADPVVWARGVERPSEAVHGCLRCGRAGLGDGCRRCLDRSSDDAATILRRAVDERPGCARGGGARPRCQQGVQPRRRQPGRRVASTSTSAFTAASSSR